MTTINKKSNIKTDAEYGIDSRYKTVKERERDAVDLMESRLERIKNLPREEVLRAKLMQLKLQMENYLKEPVYDNKNQFAGFLKTYVSTAYSRRSEFAEDINVTPVFLSQVINSHREPNEEFIVKLMIHADKVFKHVGPFHKKIWYQVYLHEKLSETMSDQSKWRQIEKQVKVTESMVK